MAIRLLSSESIDGALTLTGSLTGTTATFSSNIRVSNGILYLGNGSSTGVNIKSFGDLTMINGVSGATYYYASGTGTLCSTHQAGQIILAAGLAYGAVNSFTQIIDGSTGAITGTSATFSGNVGIGGNTPLSTLMVGDGGTAPNGVSTLTLTGANTVPEISTKPGLYHRHSIGLGVFSDYEISFEVNGATSLNEVMRIGNTGDVLINATSRYNGYPSTFVTQTIASNTGDYCPILELVGNRSAATGNQNAMIQFFNKTSTAVEVGRISSIQGSAVNSGVLTFNTTNVGTGSEKMRIDSAGNVGVGTNLPDNILHIRKGDTTYTSQVGADTMLFLETTNISNSLQFTSSTVGTQYIMFGDNDPNVGWISYAHGNNSMSFRVNAGTRLAITSGGDIEVEGGDLFLNSGTNYNDKGVVYFSNERTAIISDIVNATANGDTSLDFQTRKGGTRASAMFIDEFRNVGIGTDSPQNILHLKSNDPKIYLEDGNAGTNEKVYVVYPAGSQYVLQTQTDAFGAGQQVYVVDRTGTTVDGQKWYINNSPALVLDSVGNVGIGTTTFASTTNLQLKVGNMASGVVGEIYDAVDNADNSRLILCGGNDGAPQFSMRHYSAAYGLDIWMNVNSPWDTYMDNRQVSSGFIWRNNCNADGSEAELARLTGAGTLRVGTASTKIEIQPNGDAYTTQTRGWQLSGAVGNTSYPSYGFRDSVGEGMMSSAATNLSLVCGGSVKLNMDSRTNVAYTPDGLWNANARPTILKSSSGGGFYLGYQDNGSGLYCQAYGFLTKSTDGLGNTSERDCIQLKDANTGTINFSVTNLGTLTTRLDIIAYGSPSDKKLKENIKPVKNALDKVKKLQGVTFDWKPNDSILDIKEDIGFIAQDVKKIVPELVRENEHSGLLSMRHQGVAPILVEAIKELEEIVSELRKEIIELKKR